MNGQRPESSRVTVGHRRGGLLALGLAWLGACAPPPAPPPAEPTAPVPQAAPSRSEPDLALSVALTRQTLNRIVRDHVEPVPAGELQSRFVRQLREQFSAGPWRAPLPDAGNALEAIFAEFQQRAPGQPLLPAVESALEQVVHELQSRSAYLNLDRVRALERRETGADGSIGLRLRQSRRGFVINEVLAGSPADRAGLGRGDRLQAIDGTPTSGLLLEEVTTRLYGAPGSQVTLGVTFTNGEQRTLNLQREKVPLIPVEGRWLTRGIAYIRVRVLSESSAEEFNQVFLDLLRKVGAPRGLVLDLRDNSGGLLEAATRLADTFLDRGTVFQVHGQAERGVIKMVARPGSEVFERKLPVAVLINDYTVSGAEAIAAALQDHRRAVVVGRSRSPGVGLVHTLIPLPAQRALKLATGTLYRASGEAIEARGVVPDLCVDGGASRLVSRTEAVTATATACPYREADPSAGADDTGLLTVAVELLADRARYRQVLHRDGVDESAAR